MRTTLSIMAATILLAGVSASIGQSPQGQGKGSKSKGPPPDLEKEIIKQLKEAYKAPLEVHQDVLDDLRQSYKKPSPSREQSIIRDLHRLYMMSAEQEAYMLREIRKAIEKPSAESEKRFFGEVFKLQRLPEGTVPAAVQLMQAVKTFEKFDEDGNGKLSSDEMSPEFRAKLGRWDANRDGVVGPEEYWAYYQDRLRSISEDVATGKIDLGLKRGGPVIPPAEERRPIMFRAGKLPKTLPVWFTKLDTDMDGQVSLYEWRKGGKSLKEFGDADRNADGLITAEETLRYLAMLETAPTLSGTESSKSGFSEQKTKKE